MDWIIPAITAAAGLGGAWIMGRFTLRAQELAQREENVRNSKKLAYDSSFQEWKFLCELEIDSARAEGRKSILPPSGGFLFYSLALDAHLHGLDMTKVDSTTLIAILEDLKKRYGELLTWYLAEARERYES